MANDYAFGGTLQNSLNIARPSAVVSSAYSMANDYAFGGTLQNSLNIGTPFAAFSSVLSLANNCIVGGLLQNNLNTFSPITTTASAIADNYGIANNGSLYQAGFHETTALELTTPIFRIANNYGSINASLYKDSFSVTPFNNDSRSSTIANSIIAQIEEAVCNNNSYYACDSIMNYNVDGKNVSITISLTFNINAPINARTVQIGIGNNNHE